MMTDRKPKAGRLENRKSLETLEIASAGFDIGELRVENVDVPISRCHPTGKSTQQFAYVIIAFVFRDARQSGPTRLAFRHHDPVAAVLILDSQMREKQRVIVRQVELVVAVDLRDLIKDYGPPVLIGEERQREKRGLGDEQKFGLVTAFLEMANDVSDHRGRGVAVNHPMGNFGKLAEFVGDRSVDELLGRLGDDDFPAACHQFVGISNDSVGLPGTCEGVDVENSA